MKQDLHIVKLGGTAIDNSDELKLFLKSFARISGYKILVHGGGKIASAIGKQMNIEPQYRDGRRITDAETLHLVTMVYAGLLNKKIVSGLQHENCNALGLSGADGNAIQTIKREIDDIDYGFVGDLTPASVNVQLIQLLLSSGFVPVFNAITYDGNGQLLNTNADTIASAIAAALSSSYNVQLTYAFDQHGVLMNVNDPLSVIHELNEKTFIQLKDENRIHSGMLPKLESCFKTLHAGVCRINLCHTSALNETVNDNGTFTSIHK
jgi:acetylglutamate kinase